MKIGIDMGHTLYGPDYGAMGIKEESILTRQVGKIVIDKLKKYGYNVVNCSTDSASSVISSLSYRVNKANNENIDLFIAIHFNAGGGNGVEIYTYKGNKLTIAEAILKNISSLGYKVRGIKNGSSLYVIRNTKCPSILIECAFVDSSYDMSIFNAKKMAEAIVNAIVGKKTDNSSTNNNVNRPSNSTKINDMIKRLQRELNVQFGKSLIEDGILGSQTINALINIALGAKGNITKIIQEILISKGYNVGNYGADGVFGTNTKNAVLKFQKDKGLMADGTVGKNTWLQLLK